MLPPGTPRFQRQRRVHGTANLYKRAQVGPTLHFIPTSTPTLHVARHRETMCARGDTHASTRDRMTAGATRPAEYAHQVVPGTTASTQVAARSEDRRASFAPAGHLSVQRTREAPGTANLYKRAQVSRRGVHRVVRSPLRSCADECVLPLLKSSLGERNHTSLETARSSQRTAPSPRPALPASSRARILRRVRRGPPGRLRVPQQAATGDGAPVACAALRHANQCATAARSQLWPPSATTGPCDPPGPMGHRPPGVKPRVAHERGPHRQGRRRTRPAIREISQRDALRAPDLAVPARAVSRLTLSGRLPACPGKSRA